MYRLSAALLLTSAAVQAQTPMHLTLAEAQKQAVANHPQLSAAKLTAAAAYQVPAQLRSAYSPAFSGSFTGVGADGGSRLAAGGLNNPVLYNRVGSGLIASQLITDFGRTGNLISSARLRAEAQDQFTASTRADILLAVARAYYSVLRAQAVLKVAERTVEARQLVVDQVTALADSKLKSQLDVSFANVNLSAAKLLLAGAQNEIQATQAQLAETLGLPGQTTFRLEEEPLPGPLPDRVQPLLQEALRNRPELASLRLQEGAAERLVQAEHALFYPSIGVVGAAGFVPTGQEQVPGRYGALGVNVTIPIFNGGLFKARQAEADLKARAAAQNVTAAENRVVRDVRVAYLDALTASDRLELTRQLLDQAKLALDLAQSRYDLGLSSMVELSQAQLNLTSAQIESTRAQYDYQSLRTVVEYQIGALR